MALQLTARADQIIYDDTLENSWADWSWSTTVNLNYTGTNVHSGTASISATITSGWSALSLWHSAQDSSGFTNLTFWINGGASGGQQLRIYAELSSGAQPPINLPTLAAGTWQQMSFSLSALGVANQPNFIRFSIQDRSGAAEPTFYVDDISLQSGPPIQPPPSGTNANVTIQIDAQANRRAISPLIYGVAYASSSSVLQDLNAPLHRSGGNGTTTYNWQINAWNHAADWYFESIADSPSTAGADGDSFVQESKDAGAQAMLTIPMIGWVAKLGANGASLASYNTNKYGPQTATDPWWSAAGNGVSLATGLNITNNDPTDANLPADTNFQAGWVRHLTNTWGNATNGGLQYYLMDNEWSLWQSTHRDIHPVGPTMTEVYTDFCNYATMVKGIDPNALVAGPEEWSWPGYLYSGYDQQWASQNGYPSVSTYPDRAAHGGWDFGPWFLTQVNLRSQAAGRRLLDVFTLHCYPQENNVGTDAADSTTALLRNQSTRQFWDTNYVDPSWINSVIALIPRMRSWVTTNYPGTKIGITEYNWGAEPSINGATAQADIDGIFGREGLDLATRWTTPDPSTPTYKAMKLYRNYDGNKSTFGDTSILTVVPNPDNLSAFGAVRTGDGALTLMVINKNLTNATPITANLTNFNATGTAQRWQLTSANVITQLANITLTNKVLSDMVPAQSITLYVLPPLNAFNLQVGARSSTNRLAFCLNGQAGLAYVLQSSTDLFHWVGVSTNTLSSNSFPYLVATTNPAKMFYRGLFKSP